VTVQLWLVERPLHALVSSSALDGNVQGLGTHVGGVPVIVPFAAHVKVSALPLIV
jgi:hypothetical protein